MSLTREKEKLYEIASGFDGARAFDGIDAARETYYIPYGQSRHGSAVLEYYDAREPGDLRARLLELWNENEDMKAVIPVILAAYQKSKTKGTNYLREMEVYNYMM